MDCSYAVLGDSSLGLRVCGENWKTRVCAHNYHSEVAYYTAGVPPHNPPERVEIHGGRWIHALVRIRALLAMALRRPGFAGPRRPPNPATEFSSRCSYTSANHSPHFISRHENITQHLRSRPVPRHTRLVPVAGHSHLRQHTREPGAFHSCRVATCARREESAGIHLESVRRSVRSRHRRPTPRAPRGGACEHHHGLPRYLDAKSSASTGLSSDNNSSAGTAGAVLRVDRRVGVGVRGNHRKSSAPLKRLPSRALRARGWIV